MTRIGIDATSLSTSGKGVSTYQLNLIKHLGLHDKQTEYFIFLNEKNQLPELPNYANYTYVKVSSFNTIVMEQCHIPKWFKKYGLHLLHTNTDRIPVLNKFNIVICVFETPDYRIKVAKAQASLYKRITDTWTSHLFPMSMRKASFIISSSQSTKNDLVEKYNINPDKIEVVYLAPAEIFSPAGSKEEIQNIREKYEAKEGYILHFSSSDPRDNTQTVLKVYSKALLNSGIKQKLVIGGNTNSIKERLCGEISRLGISDHVIFTGYLNLNDLVLLYRGADLYFDPSLYEGFGLQVAEAMACGIPVIVSNTTSLPEVVGDAGIIIDLDDFEGFTKYLVELLQDDARRAEFSQKALKQSKAFSWEKTVSQTIEVWRCLLDDKPI